MQNLVIGPGQGTLTLHTGVEGRVARLGHRLTVLLQDWSVMTRFEGERPVEVTLRGSLTSLRVVSGDGGLKPLTDKDRSAIRHSALASLRADEHPEVRFASRSVTAAEGGYALDGDLTVAGCVRPATVDVGVAEAAERLSLVAEVPVVQSAHGVSPYSTMRGALRVRDRVDVRLDVSIPRP